jgi:hypothetical protein
MLHRAAFSAVPAQLGVADIEDRLLADRCDSLDIDRPVFVTSLPRAGTTVLLEILAGLPDFTSHTYRHMPFVLCPLLWDSVSRPFRRRALLRERAHGDGIAVGFDSPEAFEEVVWKAFWPHKYASDRIEPWSADERDERFETFLHRHIRKVLWLDGADGGPGRYLSKNNANIARIGLLTRLFPDCRILVPVRAPRDHAESLRRQHVRFGALHREDAFALRYMEWLGHYEFGRALRPIDFGGWLGRRPDADPALPEFWLAYWHAAYSHVLAEAGPNVTFVDYDGLCREPEPVLAGLVDVVEPADPDRLLASAADLRPARTYEDTPPPSDAGLRRAVDELHTRLLSE